MKAERTSIVLVTGLFAALVLGTGCSTTKQERSVTSETGETGAPYTGAPLRYENPSASWSGYTRMIVMPTKVRLPEGASEGEVKALELLNDKLHAVLVRELGQVFEIVTEPGPGTLRIEASMFGGQRKLSGISVMSAVSAADEGGSAIVAATDGRLSIGELGGEMKMTDAVTGDVVAASVEPRLGRNEQTAAFNSWAEAYDAIERWAKEARAALCRHKGISRCPEA